MVADQAQQVDVLVVHLFAEGTLLFLDAFHSVVKPVTEPVHSVCQTIIAALIQQNSKQDPESGNRQNPEKLPERESVHNFLILNDSSFLCLKFTDVPLARPKMGNEPSKLNRDNHDFSKQCEHAVWGEGLV